jgi:uncharacterized protein (DUF1697 family)
MTEQGGGAPDRWVALIRGINVGRANRVAMADLRELLADLGYSGVRTLLNSGNVVFTPPARDPARGEDPAPRIQEALAERLGVRARVVSLSATALDDVIGGNPLAGIATDPSRLLVAFPAAASRLSNLEDLADQVWTPEALAVGAAAAYLWCPGGVSNSRLWSAVNAAMGDAVTSRNWTTVLALQALTRRDD